MSGEATRGVIDIRDGISGLAERYDGFVLDLWGVIHDGVTLFDGVAECLDALARAGKRFVYLSNAPRRGAAVGALMRDMGLAEAHCRDVVSSGEAVWTELSQRTEPFYAGLGRRCLHIGPERDRGLMEGLDLELVDEVAEADIVLNTGPWEDEETVADYEDLLRAGAESRVAMVCANPDLEVIRGGKRIICAGALALRYEELGGRVRWIGKPHAPIYGLCLGKLGIADRRRILAVGDSLRTDIAGANAVGLASALVLGGLHAEQFGLASGGRPDVAAMEAAFAAAGQRPTLALTGFRW